MQGKLLKIKNLQVSLVFSKISEKNHRKKNNHSTLGHYYVNYNPQGYLSPLEGTIGIRAGILVPYPPPLVKVGLL